jgi:hypothetical protein
VAHVPQAKITPHSFEMDRTLDGPGIGVAPYARLNRVQLDVDDALHDVLFVIGSDLVALYRFPPAALRCDLLVLLGNFSYGAEKAASRLLGRALAAGVARTALHVNAHDLPKKRRQPPLAFKVEEVLDATQAVAPARKWTSPRALRSAFYVYDDDAARDFVSMSRMPLRKGRVAVPRSRWVAPMELGRYPVTIVL